MTKYYSFFIVLVLFFASPIMESSAQIIPSSADLSYLLNPKADIHFTHKVVTKASKKWVILNIKTNNKTVSDSLVFAYAFTNNLDNPLDNFSVVSLKNYALYETPTNKMYAFEPANSNHNFLILRTLNLTTSKTYTYIINLEKKASFFLTKTDLTIPILEGFTTKKSLIKVAKLEGLTPNFGIQFYSSHFSAALPPMANLKSQSLFEKADTSFVVTSNNILPSDKEGVYTITEENQEDIISFFRITGNRYPQLSNIQEIIDASIYLFTKKEKDKLASSTNPKKDYDAFWLENTNSEERAGKMISAYFSRVKESNTLFSSYKEGWKTDMGMIYIIFGPPNKVFRSNGSVQWVYKKTYEMPSLLFTFYLNDKNWDSEYFDLERNIKYQNTWFRAIDLWRKGRKSL